MSGVSVVRVGHSRSPRQPRLLSYRSTVLAIVCVLSPSLQAAATEYPADIQKQIDAVEHGLIAVKKGQRQPPRPLVERMRELHVPGVSVAVINNYRVEWAKGYGLADSSAGSPVTDATLFQAASMSKPIAAMMVLDLAEDGLIDLDRDVNAQLKSWKVPENEFTRQHAVDLRGILSHTAGLTVHGFPGYAAGSPLPTAAQILDGIKPANTAAVRVNKTPGHGFRYSGGGTTVMQQLVIDVTGKAFSEVMRERVLAPLEMTASGYEQPLDEQRRGLATTAYDFQGNAVAGHWHVYPELAAAGLWTTPSDVAKYVIEVQLAHEGKSAKVLAKKTIEEMLTPQNGGPVGLGPFLTERNGVRRFEHSGGNKGFSCNFVGLLDRGQGAVVMTNADGGRQLVAEITNGIAAAYGWPEYLPDAADSPD